ncbi:hypothetical protein BDM02DRAFT_3120320 [Thelephora ganbajun]|uniref:Uncharacterized protein n=1 Tax=Thelephora ganbajun TaxID=370292 RepID=A0ACB6Z6L5_THEGA|nr:hypothetical protein BDM02DRAFT_3120320 [Thelephora ganbajun]
MNTGILDSSFKYGVMRRFRDLTNNICSGFPSDFWSIGDERFVRLRPVGGRVGFLGHDGDWTSVPVLAQTDAGMESPTSTSEDDDTGAPRSQLSARISEDLGDTRSSLAVTMIFPSEVLVLKGCMVAGADARSTSPVPMLKQATSRRREVFGLGIR